MVGKNGLNSILMRWRAPLIFHAIKVDIFQHLVITRFAAIIPVRCVSIRQWSGGMPLGSRCIDIEFEHQLVVGFEFALGNSVEGSHVLVINRCDRFRRESLCNMGAGRPFLDSNVDLGMYQTGQQCCDSKLTQVAMKDIMVGGISSSSSRSSTDE
jgi:hypothetical protein